MLFMLLHSFLEFEQVVGQQLLVVDRHVVIDPHPLHVLAEKQQQLCLTISERITLDMVTVIVEIYGEPSTESVAVAL